eukprot:5379105-Pleurochrysis_carterae.AAC.1
MPQQKETDKSERQSDKNCICNSKYTVYGSKSRRHPFVQATHMKFVTREWFVRSSEEISRHARQPPVPPSQKAMRRPQ